jgi:hypothetical protein
LLELDRCIKRGMKMGKGKRVKRGGSVRVERLNLGGIDFQIIDKPKGARPRWDLEKIICDSCRQEKMVEKWEVEWMDQNIKKRLCVPCQLRSGLALGGETFST